MNKKIALFFVLLLSVGAAYAASTVTATNAPLKEWIDTGNSANNLLCATIGDIGGTGLFGDCSQFKGIAALHKILKTFNIAVFSVAALFVLWNLLAATMSSANDGDFLGKKNNSTWGPIRFVIGGSMIIPAFGGFNLAQLVMVWATAVGIGIAGAGASTAVANMEMLQQIYSVPGDILKGETVREKIKENIGCTAGWTVAVERWKADGNTDPVATQLVWGVTNSSVYDSTGAPAIMLKFGELSGNGGYSTMECGAETFPLPAPDKWTDAGQKNILTAVAAALTVEVPLLVNVISVQYTQAELGLIDVDVARSVIEKAIADFDSRIDVVAQAAVASANTTTSKISVGKGDWISLGYGDVRAAVAGAAAAKGTTSTVNSVPPKTGPPPDAVTTKPADISAGMGAVYGAGGTNAFKAPEKKQSWSEWWGGVKESTSSAKDAVTSISFGGVIDSFNSMMNTNVGKLGKMVAAGLKSKASDAGGSPLRGLIQLGVSISGWCFLVIAAWLLLAAAAAIFSVGIAGSVITTASFILFSVLSPLMFFGVKMAAYLPFLTAIIWTGAILNWLVIVLEAMFGAPLWAMVHLDLEGDGLNLQRTGHGYIFLLNLLFRPIMTVGSFVFAQLAMSALFGLFLNGVTGMLENLAVNSSGWWGNLMMVVGALWVTVVFAEQIVTQCMGLIFVIPDKVFAWISANFGSNVGADMERGIGGEVKSMAGAAGAMVTKGAGKVMAERKASHASGGAGGGTVSPSDENGMKG